MIEGTHLQTTAISLFSTETAAYVRGVRELAAALSTEEPVTAALMSVFALFVSDSARVLLRQASS